MSEAERRAVCHKIAQDMCAAGMGWHEDALLRFTAPAINEALKAASTLATWITHWQPIVDRASRGRRRKRRTRKARRR